MVAPHRHICHSVTREEPPCGLSEQNAMRKVEESTQLEYICSKIGAKIFRLRFTPLRMTRTIEYMPNYSLILIF